MDDTWVDEVDGRQVDGQVSGWNSDEWVDGWVGGQMPLKLHEDTI